MSESPGEEEVMRRESMGYDLEIEEVEQVRVVLGGTQARVFDSITVADEVVEEVELTSSVNSNAGSRGNSVEFAGIESFQLQSGGTAPIRQTGSITIEDSDEGSTPRFLDVGPINRSHSTPVHNDDPGKIHRQPSFPPNHQWGNAGDALPGGKSSMSILANRRSSAISVTDSGSMGQINTSTVARSLSRKDTYGNYGNQLAQTGFLSDIATGWENEELYLDKQESIALQFSQHELSKILEFFNGALQRLQDSNSVSKNNSEVAGSPSMTRFTSASTKVAEPPDVSSAWTSAVVVMGSINMDLIATTMTFPKPNSNQPGTDFKTIPGGKGANEAVSCGRLGVPVWMIGRVGKDDFGRLMMMRLSADANVEGISFDEDEGTGVAMIITAQDTGDKTTTTCMAANTMVDDKELKFLDWYITNKPNIRYLLTVLEINTDAVCRGAKIAHDAGKIVAVRASPVATADDYPEELWDCTDIVILGEWEAPILLQKQTKSGKTLDTFELPLQDLRQCARAAELLLDLHSNVMMVVITTAFGMVGRIRVNKVQALHSNDFKTIDLPDGELQTIVVPHFKARIVDVIGAADALTGGLIAALAHGAPVLHALVWGTMSSKHSLEATGAQESMPTIMALRKFMQERNIGVQPSWMSEEEAGPHVERWPEENPDLDPLLASLDYALHKGDHEQVGVLLRNYDAGITIDENKIESVNTDLAEQLCKPVDFQNQTLLHIAVLYADLDSVCHLLAYGADLSVKDAYGFSAMDRALDMQSKSRTRSKVFDLIKLAQLGAWLVSCFLEGRSSQKTIPQLWKDSGFAGTLSSYCQKFDNSFNEIIEGAFNTREIDLALNESRTRLENTWMKVLLYMMIYPLATSEGLDLNIVRHKSDPSEQTTYHAVRTLGRALLHKVLNKIHICQPEDFVMTALVIKSTEIRGPDNTKLQSLHAAAFVGDDKLLSYLGQSLKKLQKEIMNLQLSEQDELEVINEGTKRGHDGVFHRLSTRRAVRQALQELESNNDDGTPALQRRNRSGLRQTSTLTSSSSSTGTGSVSRNFSKHMLGVLGTRSPLHYAALGGSYDCCEFLVRKWQQDLYDMDVSGCMPIDLCHDGAFRIKLENLGLKNDAFISLGHTTKTDAAVQTMASKLVDLGLCVWWDKNADRGIAPGESWTKEITQAMKHSKTAIVILSKKWLASPFCLAEAKTALNFNKPIFALHPPVPEDEQVKLGDIPPTHILFHALHHRQTFDFRDLDLNDSEALEKRMQELATKIRNCSTNDVRQQRNWDDARETSISHTVNSPKGPLYGSLSLDDFVVIAAGVRAPARNTSQEVQETPFADILATRLLRKGIPFAIAYKPEHGAGSNEDPYWDILPAYIKDAMLVLAVLEVDCDRSHISKVLEMASANNTEVMMVPYTTLGSDTSSGMSYTANFVSRSCVCFTDWTGSEQGYSAESPAFNDIFENNFLHQFEKTISNDKGAKQKAADEMIVVNTDIQKTKKKNKKDRKKEAKKIVDVQESSTI